MNFLQFITPINLSEEKEKFFNLTNYNPVLKYCWTKEEAEEWIKTKPKYLNLVQAIVTQNNQQIIDQAEKVFSTKINDEILKNAQEIVERKVPEKNFETLEELIAEFAKALALFKLDYKIEISEHDSFNIRPLPYKKLIRISHNPSLQFFKVDDLVRHEMFHIIRYENGVYNNIEKSESYLPTEEGFASFVQDYRAGKPTTSLFQHASEYTATDIALEGSFKKIFEYLTHIGFDEDNAWKRSIRHKYGFVDTSLPGDIMKPSMYFYNEEKIKKLTIDEKLRLFVGKISLEELNKYPNYTGIFDVELINTYFL